MKRGEVQQVFIYLMVVIVVGTLMLVGYKAISGILVKGCDVDLASLKSDLRSDLQRNSNFGSVQTRHYSVSCGYEEICFVDLENAVPADINNEVIKQEISAGTGRNVFLVKGGFTEDINFVYDGITVENTNRFICIKAVGNSFTIKMEGVTRGKVKIS